MKKLEGKTAIITGAAVGIGRATAEKFAAEGCNVVLCDTDIGRLNELRETLLASGVGVDVYECDVSDEETDRRIVAETVGKYGKLDILVNVAGIWRVWEPFACSSSDRWKRFIDVNILGTMYFCHEAIPPMVKNGSGRIINVGSVAGVYGNAFMAAYSMTKGAIISFTKALAKEVTPNGVLVNCVSPGSVSNKQDEIEPSELSFLGRAGTHTENANLICFLASDEASYISGQNIQVDGCRKKM